MKVAIGIVRMFGRALWLVAACGAGLGAVFLFAAAKPEAAPAQAAAGALACGCAIIPLRDRSGLGRAVRAGGLCARRSKPNDLGVRCAWGQPIGAGQHRVLVDRSDETDILLGAWPEDQAREVLVRLAGRLKAQALEPK